ncbi:hypothetical protein [Halocatena marina]|uniref:hypothetical protein n=1 Tax=Halocatena marina TaxID=2934937 RepID=UPI00200D0FF1|nr:hypothetical protein [Halocatena marina]
MGRDDHDLRDIDEAILDKLEEGRCTRQYLANELDVTGEYIYQRIDILDKLKLVEIIHSGFYELPDHQSLAVKNETWERLNERKKLGESFNEMMTRILDESE